MESTRVTRSGATPIVASKESEKKRSHKKLYCHCRKIAGPDFMICCDGCDEWYHGECVKITKTGAKEIEKYYCSTCTSRNPELAIVYVAKKKKIVAQNATAAALIPQRCNACINCLNKDNCGECSRCKDKSGRCLEVKCLIVKQEPAIEASSPPPSTTARKAAGGGAVPDLTALAALTAKEQPPRKSHRKKKPENGHVKKENGESRAGYGTKLGQRLDAASDAYAQWNYLNEAERKAHIPGPQVMQCLGRGCIKSARSGSKYCSDECGMSLARDRLAEYLPRGVDNYFKTAPSTLNTTNQEDLKRKQALVGLEKEKENLDQWHKLLTRYVESLIQFKEPEEQDDKNYTGDHVISCVVCTGEYGSKVITKHTINCYAKEERKTTYGAIVQHPNPDDLFCDQFNKSDSSYCKRLRVLCPDHYKGGIETELTVCGWPKVWSHAGSLTMEEQFKDLENILREGFCCVSRKECKQHYGWIPTTLGSIDHLRLEYYTRKREMGDGQRAKTGDALLIMSNHTEYHQPIEQIMKSYTTEAEKMVDKLHTVDL